MTQRLNGNRRHLVSRLVLVVLGLTTATSCLSGQPTAERGRYDALSATVWLQTSGEYRALCYQAYQLAEWRLEADLRDSVRTKPRAVIVDIDETVLDNSPHQAKVMLTNTAYPAWWKDWVDRADARAIPGALEFLKMAAARRVSVFYVTNRSSDERAATLRNLRDLGFPDADTSHLLTRENGSSKEPRRRQVAATHDIVLLVGDNLADFSAAFDRQPLEPRNAAVDRLQREFGSRFILLPNPLYGDWESAVFEYGRGLPPERRHELRTSILRSFE
jgi:5'-nucleotidase (lipoprotein e(P4) family)